VETPAGKIAARAAVITVSSGVLVAGNIKFTPDIPKRQLDAAAKLGLGSYDRIALALPGNPLGLERNDVLVEQSNSMRTALLLANIGGSSLCTIDVAGSFGRDLAAQGEAQADARLDGLLVHLRQAAGKPEAGRAGVRVRALAKLVGAAAEHLRFRVEFDVHLEAEHRLVQFEGLVEVHQIGLLHQSTPSSLANISVAVSDGAWLSRV
jgi:hypothetical protein